MNVLTIAVVAGGTPLPSDVYEFGVSALNQQIVSTFQPSPVFENLDTGLYWWAVRRKADKRVIQQGAAFVQPISSQRYVSGVLEGSSFTITAAVHKLAQVCHVTVREVRADGTEQEIICIKYLKSGTQDVVVSLSEQKTKVRILIT